MTVRQLIEKLQKMEQNRIVVLAADPEGNHYDTLHDVQQMMYDDDEGEVGYDKLTPELEKQGYGEEDLMPNGKKAVVLWP